jgi:hypothetical protein
MSNETLVTKYLAISVPYINEPSLIDNNFMSQPSLPFILAILRALVIGNP